MMANLGIQVPGVRCQVPARDGTPNSKLAINAPKFQLRVSNFELLL
jgi:hypothetical protein